LRLLIYERIIENYNAGIMMKKPVSFLLILVLSTLLITSLGCSTTNLGKIIRVRSDGSIEPSTANVTTLDNETYTFTGDIFQSIIVERSGVVVDGAGYTVFGTKEFASVGISLSHVNNVTVKDTSVIGFWFGFYLNETSNNLLLRNNIEGNHRGVELNHSFNNLIKKCDISNNTSAIFLHDDSSWNTISENIIENNNWNGVQIYNSSNNSVSDNIFSNNRRGGIILEEGSKYNILSGNYLGNSTFGINLGSASNENVIFGNNITTNLYGVFLNGITLGSLNNVFYHNNFLDNINQVYPRLSLTNIWDQTYPTGGNYWSDYLTRYPEAVEINGSGIWNTPYVIDENNRDNYPLIPEFPLPTFLFFIITTIIVKCFFTYIKKDELSNV
jgi:parallel beta-helix repeat protein